MATIQLDQRRNACAMECTLDGERAKVTGAKLEYATVTCLKTNKNVEFAWTTVLRILNQDGKFRS